MAYIIGNTTVIDNNGALGAISGNSLNLANNNNIDAGGGGVKILPASSNFPVADIGSVAMVANGCGGGGSARYSGGPVPGGQGGGMVDVFSIEYTSNLTFTVGAGGIFNPAVYYNGRPGGATQITRDNPGKTNVPAGGGGTSPGSNGGGFKKVHPSFGNGGSTSQGFLRPGNNGFGAAMGL